jgi:fructoselysine-6-P-deglycase FrlB-like protein
MEYRHGPISIAAPGRAVWPFGPLPPGLAGQVRATGATLVDLGDLDPMASLVLAQRFAVAVAEARDLDPDGPRNLTRSVVLASDQVNS